MLIVKWLAWLSLTAALAAQPSSTPASAPLAAPEIKAAVEALAATVDREYFDPNVAGLVAASLKKSLTSNAYANAATPKELAQLLTGDMFAVTHDKHLAVVAIAKPADSPPPDQDRATTGRRANWGIQKAEVLPGNIGYLNITGFYHPDEARDALSAAMQFLKNADALILDLRSNLGGSPDMAALVASYMLDKPGLPLFEIIARAGERQRYATDASALSGSDGKRPLYVLTSADTFSAGEGLAFILKEQKRATIIGETTAGAANPGRSYPLTDALAATVPNGKVHCAVSGANWEGVGVAPDISVPAANALRVAQERALHGFLGQKLAPSGSWHDLLKQQLKLLDARKTPP